MAVKHAPGRQQDQYKSAPEDHHVMWDDPAVNRVSEQRLRNEANSQSDAELLNQLNPGANAKLGVHIQEIEAEHQDRDAQPDPQKAAVVNEEQFGIDLSHQDVGPQHVAAEDQYDFHQ